MNEARNEGGSVTVGLPGAVGWTYFVRVGDAIKIGSATNFKRRLHALQTAHEKPIEVLAVVPASIADEFAVHQLFASIRTRGEWFRADRELLHFIEEIKAEAANLPDDLELEPVIERVPALPTSASAMVGGLIAVRNAHGADTPMGRACSNLAEILPLLANYVRPEWATHECQTLPWLAKQQMKWIETIKAANN